MEIQKFCKYLAKETKNGPAVIKDEEKKLVEFCSGVAEILDMTLKTDYKTLWPKISRLFEEDLAAMFISSTLDAKYKTEGWILLKLSEHRLRQALLTIDEK
jgi:hypothetical protein